MDYTKVPRALIYKDRTDIDEFPVIERFDPPQMEARFLDALEERPFIKESYDAPELILQIFNNARYITTLICLENHPNHYLHKYLAIAGSNSRNITIVNHVVPATMALVRNYLCNYFTVYIGSKIVEEITNHFNTDAWKKDTIGGQDDFYKLLVGYSLDNEIVDPSSVHPLWISDEDFKPRDIKETIKDPLFTARDISENIDYILDTLQNSVEIFDEEIEPLNIMYKKVESWFPSGIDDNLNKELALGKIDTRLKKLDPNNAYEFFNIMNDIEKELYYGQGRSSATKEKISKYLKKTLGFDLEEIEAAYQSAKQVDDETENIINDNDAGDKSSEEESKQDDIKEVNKEEWDSQYDDVFDSRLNPEKIFKKLEKMDNPRVTDDYPRFFVFFKVLLYLGWIEKSQNKFLKWANCHWKCKWNKEYNFKFGNNIKKELRDTHLSKWSSATLPNSDIGDAYRTLAIDVFSKLTETVNGNKIIDRSSFYNKDAKVRINDGKNLEYPY